MPILKVRFGMSRDRMLFLKSSFEKTAFIRGIHDD